MHTFRMKFQIFLIMTACMANISSVPLPVPDEEVARKFTSDNQTVLIDESGNFISIDQRAGKTGDTKGKTTDKNDVIAANTRNEVPSKTIHPLMHSIPDIEKQNSLDMATHKELINVIQEKLKSDMDVVKIETGSTTEGFAQVKSELEYATSTPTMSIEDELITKINDAHDKSVVTQKSLIDKIPDSELTMNEPTDFARSQEMSTPPTNVSSMGTKSRLDKTINTMMGK